MTREEVKASWERFWQKWVKENWDEKELSGIEPFSASAEVFGDEEIDFHQEPDGTWHATRDPVWGHGPVAFRYLEKEDYWEEVS